MSGFAQLVGGWQCLLSCLYIQLRFKYADLGICFKYLNMLIPIDADITVSSVFMPVCL